MDISSYLISAFSSIVYNTPRITITGYFLSGFITENIFLNPLPLSEIVGNGIVTFKLINSIDLADKIIDLVNNDFFNI